MPILLWYSMQCSGAVSIAPTTEQSASKPNYSDLHEKNIFDPNRQPWAENPPESAVPSVPPLNPGDIEVYGVMSIGSYKKVIIKLGSAFKLAPSPGAGSRPFIMLAIGQALGPYTLVEVSGKNIVFEGGGARYLVTFAAKKDRPPAGPAAPIAQEPVVLPAPVPTLVPGITPVVAEPIATAPQQAAQPETQPAPAQLGQQPLASASSAAAAPASPETAASSPAPQIQGQTLLEAIQMARQAQQSGASPTPSPFVKR